MQFQCSHFLWECYLPGKYSDQVCHPSHTSTSSSGIFSFDCLHCTLTSAHQVSDCRSVGLKYLLTISGRKMLIHLNNSIRHILYPCYEFRIGNCWRIWVLLQCALGTEQKIFQMYAQIQCRLGSWVHGISG